MAVVGAAAYPPLAPVCSRPLVETQEHSSSAAITLWRCDYAPRVSLSHADVAWSRQVSIDLSGSCKSCLAAVVIPHQTYHQNKVC